MTFRLQRWNLGVRPWGEGGGGGGEAGLQCYAGLGIEETFHDLEGVYICTEYRHLSVNIARVVAVHFIDQVVRNEKEKGCLVRLSKYSEDIVDSIQC